MLYKVKMLNVKEEAVLQVRIGFIGPWYSGSAR